MKMTKHKHENKASEMMISPHELAALVEDAICVCQNGVIEEINPAGRALLGFSGRKSPVGRSFIEFVVGKEKTKPLKSLTSLTKGKAAKRLHLFGANGRVWAADVRAVKLDSSKRNDRILVIAHPVEPDAATESELKLAATVFEHISAGLLVANSEEVVTKVNRAFTVITGYSEKDVIGQTLKAVLFDKDENYHDTMDDLRASGQVEWEQWCKNKADDKYAARKELSLVRGADGSVQQYAAIIDDITERKLDEEQIRYQANYDHVTGLPNRSLFMDRLSRSIIESRRAKTNVGLMFLDLDGFKVINDTLGHDAGDLLLQQTAARLGLCVRESDTVARLGGDEFTIIMPLIDNIQSTVVVAERILHSLTKPFNLAGEEKKISASIGISIYPDQAADEKQLLHNADVAMFHAKAQHKGNYQFFRDGLEIDGVPER
ncbi:MAG: diguanylate cyclase domain-containing protein [Rhodospirillaceae bacterium]